MLNFNLLCFWPLLKQIAYYAQYYALNYMPQFMYNFIISNSYISIGGLQSVIL